MKNKEEKGFLLALYFIKGLGSDGCRKLVVHFGSAAEVFNQKPEEIVSGTGIPWKVALAIEARSSLKQAQDELAYCEEMGIKVLLFTESEFPSSLRELKDAPPVIFVKGKADLNQNRRIAIVGTRRATNYGKELTQKFVEELAPYNPVIVSGLAYGIDIEAHRKAIEGGLSSWAVLAHGLDLIYPYRHKRTAEEMLENGALITEFPSGGKLNPRQFPRRNRIVAGLVDALVVIESGISGGSLISAKIAWSYQREVFAFPGRVGDEQSSGCNRLLKEQKAVLIESAEDFAWQMGWPEIAAERNRNNVEKQLKGEELRVFKRLQANGNESLHLNVLSSELNLNSGDLSLILLQMELAGLIKSVPGNRYKLI